MWTLNIPINQRSTQMPSEMQRVPTFKEIECQAINAVSFYLECAIEEIDKHLGAGFAKKNPALLGAFIQACVTDNATMVSKWYLGDNVEAIHHALLKIADRQE
jgi:hypothetical protein